MAKKILTVKTKYGAFRCIFEIEKDMGGYSAEAIGIQGAISWGRNLKEAKENIKEAIEGAVEAYAIATAEKKGIVRMVKRKGHILSLV
jgi:predicted RNase H-like HicB family nuclease